MPKGEPPADEAQAAAFRAARRRASQAGRRFRFQGTAPTPHEREVDAKLSSFFNVVFVLMIVFQFCVMLWRKHHPRSYTATTLCGLWLFPLFFSEYFHLWTFLTTWVVFSAITGTLLFLASRRPLAASTPRRVYSWFLGVYKLSVAGGSLAGALIFADVFGVPTPPIRITKGFTLWPLGVIGFVVLFYALYYGVLARDLAEVCANWMASSMGVPTKGGKRERGAPGGRPALQAGVRADLRFTRNTVCSICNLALPGEGGGGSAVCLPAARAANMHPNGHTGPAPGEYDRVVTLPGCKHQFHEFCLRGWVIVGKKDTCPYCCEKCDLRALSRGPWDNHSLTWMHLLDAMRYLVVWNPIILVFTFVLLKMSGLEPLLKESHDMHEAHMKRDKALLEQMFKEAEGAETIAHAIEAAGDATLDEVAVGEVGVHEVAMGAAIGSPAPPMP